MATDNTRPVRDLLVQALDVFFDNADYFMTMFNIINHKDAISLRLLEFMFTKYSRRHSAILVIEGNPLLLSDVYNYGLEAYGKIHYDCFKRHDRVLFAKHGLVLESTIGQLHFFKHVLPTGAIEFAREHLPEIRAEMADYLKEIRAKDTPDTDQEIGTDTVARMTDAVNKAKARGSVQRMQYAMRL